jgi:hypothetical protein
MEASPTISPEVADLINRIKGLVAEKQRPDLAAGRREALGREIASLQRRLGDLVRRELTGT